VGGETFAPHGRPARRRVRNRLARTLGLATRIVLSTRSSSSLKSRHDMSPAGMPRIRVRRRSTGGLLEVANSRWTTQDEQTPVGP